MNADSVGARLRRGEVDGVPAFWLAGGARSDTITAALWFRIGTVDMPLVQHGWLHLLEHLALHGEDLVRRPVDGAVELLTTAFEVDGPAADVVDFLAELCRFLSEPSFAGLEHERRVLHAESRQRQIGAFARHLMWRYGAEGPGLIAHDEFGLGTATSTDLAELARRAFTRGNAALALTGPPPANLSLPLSDGSPIPAPRAVPCDQPYPAAFPDPVGGIAMTGVTARSTAATSLTRLLQRELQIRVRDELGVGYSAWATYEPVDADTAALGTGIDVLPEARERIVELGLGLVERIVRGEFSAADVHDDGQRAATEMRTAEDTRWAPWRVAREVVLQRDLEDVDEVIAETESVTPDDLAAVAETVRDTLLVGVDREPRSATRISWLGRPPTSAAARAIAQDAAATTFQPVDYPIDRGVLGVSERHAQVIQESNPVLVADTELAALLAFPDGARTLIRRDGYQLVIEPTLWRHGARATALVDLWSADGLRVPMPSRDQASIPRPETTRLRRALGRLAPFRRRPD